MGFNVAFHHMGRFERNRGLKYVGGEIHVVKGIDPNFWSFFEALGIVKEFKYGGEVKLWWKGSKQSLLNNLRLLSDDKEAIELANFAEKSKEEVDIYVQHVPSQAEIVHFIGGLDEVVAEEDVVVEEAEVNDGDAVVREAEVNDEEAVVREPEVNGENDVVREAEEAEVNGGNDVVREVEVIGEEDLVREAGVNDKEAVIGEDHVVGDAEVNGEEEQQDPPRDRLDDSEEERMADDDDGFGMDNNSSHRKIGPVLERWKEFKRNSSKVKNKRYVSEGSFVTNEEIGEHEINEEYMSDDLDSDVDNDDGILNVGPKFSKYKPEDMKKDFKFKLGMEFSSLKDFKYALMEHSVLNGKEVKFVKNDHKRVRAVCKRKCGFLIMVSKVGGKQTFRVKTLVGGHKCGRVFGNKNANTDWIAQVLIDRFMNVGLMTVNQIIDEIKKTYSVGITAWRAGKAKQIAMDNLVGDGQRQYNRLFDYVGELLRVKAGTFKVKINQPQPTLPPRFGSFYMCLDGCKQGFVAGCRPFIGVDGCHLKTAYGGQLLVAVGRDPNDQYFPLAFAVVENECKETWRWFLTLLLQDIGDIDSHRWVFISDQQKVKQIHSIVFN